MSSFHPKIKKEEKTQGFHFAETQEEGEKHFWKNIMERFVPF